MRLRSPASRSSRSKLSSKGSEDAPQQDGKQRALVQGSTLDTCLGFSPVKDADMSSHAPVSQDRALESYARPGSFHPLVRYYCQCELRVVSRSVYCAHTPLSRTRPVGYRSEFRPPCIATSNRIECRILKNASPRTIRTSVRAVDC